MTNLVSNAGVVATDVTGVGTARSYLAGMRIWWVIKESLVMGYWMVVSMFQ